MPDSHKTFFVIEGIGPWTHVWFDVRHGIWRHSIEEVQTFESRERATAYALEFRLEDKVVVVPYRLVPNSRPERLSHDEDHGPDYP